MHSPLLHAIWSLMFGVLSCKPNKNEVKCLKRLNSRLSDPWSLFNKTLDANWINNAIVIMDVMADLETSWYN